MLNINDFERTGEKRLPLEGEWYLNMDKYPARAEHNFTKNMWEILKPKEKGMKLKDCKLGMKVKPPKTARGIPLERTLYTNQLGESQGFNIIERIVGGIVHLHGMDCWPSDLEPYEREKPRKYKSLKPISAVNAIGDKANENFLVEFIMAFGVYQTVPPEEFVDWCWETKRDWWIDWAERHGYFKEVEEEKTYHVGQRFRISGGLRNEYLLAIIDSYKVNFINPDGTGCCTSPMTVNNCNRITQAELNQLCSDAELIE